MKVERVPRVVYEYNIQITLAPEEARRLGEELDRLRQYYGYGCDAMAPKCAALVISMYNALRR